MAPSSAKEKQPRLRSFLRREILRSRLKASCKPRNKAGDHPKPVNFILESKSPSVSQPSLQAPTIDEGFVDSLFGDPIVPVQNDLTSLELFLKQGASGVEQKNKEATDVEFESMKNDYLALLDAEPAISYNKDTLPEPIHPYEKRKLMRTARQVNEARKGIMENPKEPLKQGSKMPGESVEETEDWDGEALLHMYNHPPKHKTRPEKLSPVPPDVQEITKIYNRASERALGRFLQQDLLEQSKGVKRKGLGRKGRMAEKELLEYENEVKRMKAVSESALKASLAQEKGNEMGKKATEMGVMGDMRSYTQYLYSEASGPAGKLFGKIWKDGAPF
ncbi:hypothetical protein BP5796_01534 [Coleophoma crateriformis]|uniref:Uncharacterized protein n=1 Tax=Coleophoma crateriformis TaxID=565419 RepID=A0A3D8T0T9_9HELO|nr:hypothetical protein BP5796_01534 [Coleophoma crateriformis]